MGMVYLEKASDTIDWNDKFPHVDNVWIWKEIAESVQSLYVDSNACVAVVASVSDWVSVGVRLQVLCDVTVAVEYLY